MRTNKEINYSRSIQALFRAIKKKLIKKIKEKDSNYEYESIDELENKAILCLPTRLQSCAIALHKLVMHPKDEAFEYNMLLNIYKNLK